MSDVDALLSVIQALQREIRDAVVAACSAQSEAELGGVADDGPGVTVRVGSRPRGERPPGGRETRAAGD